MKKASQISSSVNQKGQFANIEEAVQYKHEELKRALKGIDLNKLTRKSH
jgi:hypothetical protein